MYFDIDYNFNNQQHYVIVDTQEAVESFYTQKRDVYTCEDGETLFIIVRHGENESNLAGLYDGRTLNKPLTEKGYVQAAQVGQKLSAKFSQMDQVLVSTMIRTDQTARKILEAFPNSQPTITHDERLLERYVGKYEAGSLKAIEPANLKDKKISASREHSFEEKMNFIPEEGVESYASIWERAHASLQEAHLENKGKIVLVVTHSGTVRSIYWYLAKDLGFFVPYEDFKPDNGAYMIVSAKDGQMTLLETDNIKIGK